MLRTIRSLEELSEAITHNDRRLPWNEYGGFLRELPSFGGEPERRPGVVSWDATRLLIRDDRGHLEIIRRSQCAWNLSDSQIERRTWVVRTVSLVCFFAPMIFAFKLLRLGAQTLAGFHRGQFGYSLVELALGLILAASGLVGLLLALWVQRRFGVRYPGARW
jgi:hypothetical protein